MTSSFDFRKGSKKRQKDKAWKRQEARLAADLDGKVQSGSGNQDGKKGDVKYDLVLLEAKSTEKKSISLKMSWLEKIDEEAVAESGRIPALGITFTGIKRGTEKDWIIIPSWAMNMLMQNYKEDDL